MQYLIEEYDKIDKHLDFMISASKAPVSSTQSGVEEHGIGTGSNTTDLLDLGELNDPDKVKQKGRPQLPTRLKPLVEEIRQKVAREEKKKQ